jgi:hypothetical protein
LVPKVFKEFKVSKEPMVQPAVLVLLALKVPLVLKAFKEFRGQPARKEFKVFKVFKEPMGLKVFREFRVFKGFRARRRSLTCLIRAALVINGFC